MDILDDMGVSKLSAKVFLKVNYSFKISILEWFLKAWVMILKIQLCITGINYIIHVTIDKLF